MEENFDNLFKISAKALMIIQLHPKLKRDLLWFVKTCLLSSIVVSGVYFIGDNMINYDLKNGDFSQASQNGTFVIVYIMIAIQFTVLIISKEPLMTLMKDMKNDYELCKKMTAEEQMITQSYIVKGVYISKQWLITSFSSLLAFVGRTICLSIYYYWIDDYRPIHYYDLIYPDFIEKRKNEVIPFAILYVYLALFTLYSIVMYTSYVPLGPIMMLHACGQMEIVKGAINNLFVELDDNVIQEKLNTIIIRLQYIYDFAERITNIFKIAYELTLKGTIIVLPVAFYEVIEAGKRFELSLECTTIIVGGILISTTPCYYSNLLKDKGEEIRMALYTCGWERHYVRRVRTSLLIMLLYAERPVAIKTVFNTLCLEALTDVFHQAYAIFNLINAMWG